ncbi:hypothetical protein PHLCEN_2v11353 [Hermanssonia centrifuga]|uniref:Uncharacterized protein n=1 Tax=Hermanssonia centrifuga TaxID=98765 RepID=A0A2R6NK97_9APHY|nr:hypothetical protein PHLCEN_2v11353 [Hermanssonia centrifuga]
MLEEVTVGDFIQSIFFSYGISAGAAHGRDWLRRSMTLTNPDASQVLLVTHRARILRIPYSTRIGNIWAGAKWPRQSLLAFEDLRSTSRQRPHEIDGAFFNKGYTVDLHVLRNEEIPA